MPAGWWPSTPLIDLRPHATRRRHLQAVASGVNIAGQGRRATKKRRRR